MNKRKILIITVLIAAFLLASILGATVIFNKHPSPVKVILDCDMGYMNDDAVSLSMLLKAEERGLVKIIGITLEGGNNFIDAPYENYGEIQYGSSQCTENLLVSLNRKDIPYFRGTDFPINRGKDDTQKLDDLYKGLEYINDGYGAIHFFTSVNPELLCDSNDAANFLVKSVQENPNEVVIIANGPTMNVAKAIQLDSNFAQNVKAIYYMGGALGETCKMENNRSEIIDGIDGANVTPYAEYNVIYDPASFEICITAPFSSQYIVPGSCNVPIDKSITEKFIAHSEGTGISGMWAEYYKHTVPDYPYWDPMTVFAFLCPNAVIDSSTKYVTVNTDCLSKYFGQTDGCSYDEYNSLPLEQQALYGKAEIIYKMDGFWDYTIDLLCN